MPDHPRDPADKDTPDTVVELQRRVEELEKEAGELRRLLHQLAGTTEEAQQNLSQHNEPLRGIITALHDTIIVGYDREGRYLFIWMDPGLEKRYGMRAGDLLGTSMRDMFPLEVAAQRITGNRKTLETGERHHEEYALELPGGTFWHDITLAPMRDREGRPTAVVGIIRDITRRKRAEQEQQEMAQRMARTEKLESLWVMAGGVAHDLNNLLMGVMANAELMDEHLDPLSEEGGRLQRVLTSARHARALVEQLLDCSGRGRHLPGPCRLDQLVAETIETTRPALSPSVSVQLEIPEPLPGVQADPDQVRQVVVNLLHNAAEASGAGQGGILVRVTTVDADAALLQSTYLAEDLPAGRYACIEVRDHGCGLTEDQQRRVFDPFYTTKPRGRGLGLAAVLGIVRAHRGAVRLRSSPGEGTAFQILLPAGSPGD